MKPENAIIEAARAALRNEAVAQPLAQPVPVVTGSLAVRLRFTSEYGPRSVTLLTAPDISVRHAKEFKVQFTRDNPGLNNLYFRWTSTVEV